MSSDSLSHINKIENHERNFEKPPIKTQAFEHCIQLEAGSGNDDKADKEILEHSSFDILNDRSIKVDRKFVLQLKKKNTKTISREIKDWCKVLKFSYKWNVNEVLSALTELHHKEYPNLFIFIIESKNFGFLENVEFGLSKEIEKLQKILLNFSKSRPLVLQLTSKKENVRKFYYKELASTQFIAINDQLKDFKEIKDFSSFLCLFLNENIEHFEDFFTENFSQIQNLSLILSFIRTLTSNEQIFHSLLNKILMKCAECGSKANLFAILDVSFEDDGWILGDESSRFLSSILINGQWMDQNESSTKAYLAWNNINLGSSILLTAINNKNREIIDYLTTYCTHLIQKLPFNHQIKISTTALETNQLDVLCDLLNYSNFPFPSDFNIDFIDHEGLCKIVAERIKFENAIKMENLVEISEFMDNNINLKIIYNIKNNSALMQAVASSNLKIYVFLKLRDFYTTNPNEDFKEANKYAANQRRRNVNEALPDEQRFINTLCNRSFIHNKRISKLEEMEYRNKIRKWYESINQIKFGSELLNVAASCKSLKIIFDFENDTVENLSLAGPYASGSMYPAKKWIFLGAKLSDKKREQQIKGVLAHELCHYVMRLVFENCENPYYKHKEIIAQNFETLVNKIDKWSADESEGPDDECNGIISSVFQLYLKRDFHPEVIVRVVQILTEFDDDGEKLKYIQKQYKELFDFWELFVIPELKNFNLIDRESVRKMNRTFELLDDIKSENIDFSSPKDIKSLFDDVIIVSTNVPKLLLISVCNHLQKQYGNLLNSQTFFIDPQKLKNQEIFSDFSMELTNNPRQCIVDCSQEMHISVKEISIFKETNSILVVSNETQRKELEIILKTSERCPKGTILNYTWSDLTIESQKILFRKKINFQNNLQFSFMDLLKKPVIIEKRKHWSQETKEDNQTKWQKPEKKLEINTLEEQETRALLEFSEIIDDNYLKFLFDPTKISINSKLENEKEDYHFVYLLQPRRFICKSSTGVEKLLQSELLPLVRSRKYVLISDIAGNGKSWIMKYVARTLCEYNPEKWVAYIDLKQFIGEFKAQASNREFSTFFAKNILKLKENQFDANFFKKLYKHGKVSIIFDGFDEIAPHCAEFVSKLAKSFEWNGGNQLWIATRDYFEVNLKEELGLDVVYKLDEFTEKDGINLIVACWVLTDIKDIKTLKSRKDFDEYVKNSSNFESYQQKAYQIVKNVAMSEDRSVGMPQLFKMIAEDCFIDDKDTSHDLKRSEIYRSIVQNIYMRWSREKGQLREDASFKSQEYILNFWKLHQYSAIKSMFPEILEIFFQDYNMSEWPEEEIIGCGLMNKRGKTFYFLHETFREFFVADFIAKALMELKTNRSSSNCIVFNKKKEENAILKLVVEVLTDCKFGVVLMFLNDALNDYSTLQKIQHKMGSFIDRFYKLEDFDKLFTKKLDNLSIFVIAILKNGNYKRIKKILDNSARNVAWKANDSQMFLTFYKFLIEFLKTDDLKEIIEERFIFQAMIESSLEIEVFVDFVIKIEAISDREFMRKVLELVNWKGNIFYCLCTSSQLDTNKVQKFLEVMQKFFSSLEIFELMHSCTKSKKSILQLGVEAGNRERFINIWTEVEKFSEANNLPHAIKKLTNKKYSYNKNVLHSIIMYEQVEFHKTLWEFLFKTFENRDELMELIFQKDRRGNNFVHLLVQENKNADITGLTFKILKENFSNAQFREILKSKGQENMSIFQTAVYKSKHINHHQILWSYFYESFRYDEVLEIFKNVDLNGSNILHIAVERSSDEVFEFAIRELEKIASTDEIKKVLTHLDKYNRNLLHSLVRAEKLSKIHVNLWKIFSKYFKPSEILEFIHHVDYFENNILFIAVENNVKEIVEETWKEIKSYMSQEEQAEYLKKKNWEGKILTKKSIYYDASLHEWVKNLLLEYGVNE